MIDLYEGWIRDFPIGSIEDGLAETDWEGWQRLTARLGSRIQLVGDDIFVTNPNVIASAIGAPARGERVAKYNQLFRIEEELGSRARYAGTEFVAAGGFRRA